MASLALAAGPDGRGRHLSLPALTNRSPALFHWWGRSCLKEVIDYRAYGSVSCEHGHTAWCDAHAGQRLKNGACGGVFGGRTSSEHIRTGWQGAGQPCDACDNSQRYLNCGHAPPAAAQRRARRLYAADFTADAPEPAPVHGQCFGPGFSTAVDLRARSPREFFYLANDCAYAYLWWPPNG